MASPHPDPGGDRNGAGDIESQGLEGKTTRGRHGISSFLHIGAGDMYRLRPEENSKWYQKLLDLGVEENGIKPVPLEFRTQTKYSDIFTVYFTCLLCILP